MNTLARKVGKTMQDKNIALGRDRPDACLVNLIIMATIVIAAVAGRQHL